MPEPSAVARAYFLSVEPATVADEPGSGVHAPAPSDATPAADARPDPIVELLDALRDAGVVPQAPRALLERPAGESERLARIRAGMQAARERDELAYLRRGEELAYLANALIAGTPIQGRPMTASEASDAAVAVCNLGLEFWPSKWKAAQPSRSQAKVAATADNRLPDDFLVLQDLVRVFEVGWSVLHHQVCVHAAERLVEVLGVLKFDDSDLRKGINALRRELSRGLREGAPWRARDALDVIEGLDMLAWAGLLGLIDQYPVMHAAIRASVNRGARSVGASDFEFISEPGQIALLRQFLDALPDFLRP
jgi:hypothetical protein